MNSSTSNHCNTRIPDPWSEYGYADWKDNAMEVRKAWMQMMGLAQEEIEEHCREKPPIDPDEELAEYNAMFAIQELNNRQ